MMREVTLSVNDEEKALEELKPQTLFLFFCSFFVVSLVTSVTQEPHRACAADTLS